MQNWAEHLLRLVLLFKKGGGCMEINLTQVVGEIVIHNANSPSAAKRLEQMRPQIMNYLSDNCLYIFRQKVAEVYQINSFRTNIVPLDRFLGSVVSQINGWSCKIFFDEQIINWEDAKGDPIYKINYTQNEESEVHDLYSYWQTPIEGKREDDYYTREAIEAIAKFVTTDFVTFIKQLIRR